MNYEQTLIYLFTQLPMYQRVGKAAYKGDLNNTINLCRVLENPENKFKSIHVAGTNGKGSTSHMLASILQESGYKVGLYTSPHLKDFRERIKINGEVISETYVVDFVKKNKTEFEQLKLSFFEWTVGLAFDYFASQDIDLAVIETGLGGRLDSTNVITPEIAIITNIGIDHTQFLGNTLTEIATEKAGIIKPKIPIIIGEDQPEIREVFIKKTEELKTSIYFADQIIKTKYTSDLLGEYQKKNIKTAVLVIQLLNEKGWHIDKNHLKKGLLNVIKNTGLSGRWQILKNQPLTICDTGHNEDGIKEVVKQLKKIAFRNLHFIYGAVNDKSIDKIIELLPKKATYYFCQAKIPRALNADDVFKLAEQKGLKGTVYKSVPEAFQSAQENADKEDLIFIGGSTFVVAEVL